MRFPKHQRRVYKRPVLHRVTFLLCVCIFLAFIIGMIRAFRADSDRITVAFASHPVIVFSVDLNDRSATVITLPDETVTEGAYGYGRYTLKSLWKLGYIDRKDSNVFQFSLSNALGIPIDATIGTSTDEMMSLTDTPVAYVRSVFSLRRLLRHFSGTYSSTLSVADIFALTRAVFSMKSDDFEHIDFTKRSVTYEEKQADNSIQYVIDTQRVDALLKNVFQDADLRKEALTISLFNTTHVPVLASRAARLLTSLGILVISVDNSESTIDSCIIKGSRDVLQTKTSREIQRILQCVPTETDAVTNADLEVYIGSDFSKRYVSAKDVQR